MCWVPLQDCLSYSFLFEFSLELLSFLMKKPQLEKLNCFPVGPLASRCENRIRTLDATPGSVLFALSLHLLLTSL
jgi:hypothetical protein